MAHIKKVLTAARLSQWNQVQQLIQKYGVSIDEYIHPISGDTLLHYAARSFNGADAIPILLEYIDVNSTNRSGYTALHTLVVHCVSRCDSEISIRISAMDLEANIEQCDTIERCLIRAKMLIAAGVDVNLYPTNPHLPTYGISAYHIACNYNGQRRVMQPLIELLKTHGANLAYVKELYKETKDSIQI